MIMGFFEIVPFGGLNSVSENYIIILALVVNVVGVVQW